MEPAPPPAKPAVQARAGASRAVALAATQDGAPPWRLQSKIRQQLLALLAGVWLLASAAAGLALWHETDEVLNSALTETAERLLLLPDAALAEHGTAEHGANAASLALLARHKAFVVYQVFDQARTLRLRSRDAPATALDAAAPDGLRVAQGWLVRTLSTPDGARRAQVAETVAHRHEVLWASLGWLLGMLGAMLPLAALGVGWVLRRGFGALESSRRTLAARLGHDLSPLPLAAAPAELQPWLDTVNQLLRRVQAMVDGERAFAASTAHELRTPLAAARAQAQRLVQASTDAATREPALALLRQLDRLTHLATRLLQLARIESGVALNREPVDLVQLALLVADDFAEHLRSGRLRLQSHGQPMPVQGDIDALGIALRNLIDNALKHGGDEATVAVHIEGQTLRVEDDGPGVPADRVPSLVQKFQRGRGAHLAAGSGLGLAMVETIAQQSGARLLLRSPLADGRGFGASLRFDLGPAPRRPRRSAGKRRAGPAPGTGENA